VSGVRIREARVVAAATGALGALLIARPEAVARACSGRPNAVPRSWIVRALGGRMLLQALVEAARPQRRILDGGIATDAAHGASMVALATVSQRYRRPAAISAAVAGVSTVLGLACRTAADR
jgi:hypothetical protein